MAWIEAHQSLQRHPKLKALAVALGVSKNEVMGALICLWFWAVDYAADGDLSSFTEQEIADAMEWKGDCHALRNALRVTHWIDDDVTLHNWENYTKKSVVTQNSVTRKKENDRKRQARYREKQRLEMRNAPVTCDVTLPSRTPQDITGHNINYSCAETPPSGAHAPAESTKETKHQPPAEPPLMTFPTDGPVKEWGLTASKMREWQGTYSGINVEYECKKARQWCIDNPGKRKTERGMPAFLTNWLSRATNAPRAASAPPPGEPVRSLPMAQPVKPSPYCPLPGEDPVATARRIQALESIRIRETRKRDGIIPESSREGLMP